MHWCGVLLLLLLPLRLSAHAMHLGLAAQPSASAALVDLWQRRAVRTRSPTECRSLLALLLVLLRALLLPLEFRVKVYFSHSLSLSLAL